MIQPPLSRRSWLGFRNVFVAAAGHWRVRLRFCAARELRDRTGFRPRWTPRHRAIECSGESIRLPPDSQYRAPLRFPPKVAAEAEEPERPARSCLYFLPSGSARRNALFPLRGMRESAKVLPPAELQFSRRVRACVEENLPAGCTSRALWPNRKL